MALRRDFDAAGRRNEQEITRTSRNALYIKRASPSSYGCAWRQFDDLGLTAVRHTQKTSAGHLKLHGATLVGPELIARQYEGVGGGVAPVGIGCALHHGATRFIADARMHGRFGHGRHSRPNHCQQCAYDDVSCVIGSHDLNLLTSSFPSLK